jgi:hypothetical protein
MDIGSILLGLALLLVVAFIIARPLLAGSRGRERQPGPLDELLAERERVLLQLRDLDFDYATAKIMDADYTAQRAHLVARGVEILKQLDALAATVGAPAASAAGNGRAAALDAEIESAVASARRPAAPAADDIEALVAERRSRAAPAAPLGQAACAECGAAVGASDRFCPKCGAPQTLVCPACGRAARAGDQFCGGCGQRLPARAGGLSQAQAPS